MRTFFIILLSAIGLAWLGYTINIFLGYNKLWMNVKISNGIYFTQVLFLIGKNILTLIIFIIVLHLSND